MVDLDPSGGATPAADAAPNGWPRWVLEGFRDGRVEALTEVYRLHVREVTGQLRHGFSFSSKGRAHRFVGYHSAFELQDALHETFRRAFEPRARDSYDGLRPYGPYLRTIARNVVLRGFRAREVQFPEVADAEGGERRPVELADTETATPEQDVASAQVREVVAAYLETLESVDRELLTLRFVEGKSQRDVADALGLGRQVVRGREAKLRKGLLVFLRERGESGLVPGAVALLLALVLTPGDAAGDPDAPWTAALRKLVTATVWGGRA